MSEPSAASPDKTSQPKPGVSPARNIIGVIVLVAVVAVGVLQYSQLISFNSAVGRLDARAKDDAKDLMTPQEAEELLGKAPDGPGTEFMDGNYHFTKKTYTWPGVLKSYTLAAFYTTGKEPKLHHYESEGAKLPPPEVHKPVGSVPRGQAKGGTSKKQASPPPPKPAPEAEGAKPAETPKPAPAPAPAPAKDGK